MATRTVGQCVVSVVVTTVVAVIVVEAGGIMIVLGGRGGSRGRPGWPRPMSLR